MSSVQENKKKRAIFRYFEIIFQKASKLILLNLIYFVCIFPLLCGSVFGICALFDVSATTVQAFYFVHFMVWIVTAIPTPVFLVLFMASLIAYGPMTAGFTYCIRNIATDNYCWVSDMFTHAKSNLKQGLALGIIDLIVVSSCILYLASSASFLEGASLIMLRTMQIVSVIITIIYIWIRFYSYAISVTFELKLKDIFKNSLIFCVLGFFRNILAMAVCAFVIFTFTSTPKVDIVLIAVLLLSICRFTALFSTYPIIKQYMLKAIKAKESESN